MSRYYSLLFLLSLPFAAHALDNVVLRMKSLQAQDWRLEDISVALTDIKLDKQQLTLTIDSLRLPKPFDDVRLLNIRCSDFSWQNQELICKQGRAELHSKRWQSPAANFSFHIKENDNVLTLTDVRVAGGRINLQATEQSAGWQLQVHAKGLQLSLLGQLIGADLVELKSGRGQLKLEASGSGPLVDTVTMTAALGEATGQSKDAVIAAERAKVKVVANAGRVSSGWQWQSHMDVHGGALYVQPFYLDTQQHAIAVDGQGLWQADNQQLYIQSLRYHHDNTGTLQGNALLDFHKQLTIDNARFSISSANLENASPVYLQPLLAQTALEGLSVTGQGRAELSMVQQSLTALSAVFNQVAVLDEQQRFAMRGGNGVFNWSDQETFTQPSWLAWQQLMLSKVPVDAAKLEFLTKAKSVKLLKKAELPVLGGIFAIKQFSWLGKAQQEPEVFFEGDLQKLSLVQLSKAMDWTPLAGTISGAIPKIEYSNKTFSLGGQLLIKVFDGDVKISNLAASGLFTALPKLYGEMEVENLDMDQLTGQFKFGGITGKLSGYVRQLYMENWQPVSFYAWFGTPDDDDSKHRISQKAVNNIANIGGGGASDLLSRGVLSAFDTFGYDKIGLGCYLHDGVCQLMGIEATAQGYTIIKGGGLPRIDVIGYNPRVDWLVLLDRLKRISTSDEVIIK
ncbi:MAG: C4-dicarboxylate ABC transporter [Methylococcales bacterium]